MILREKSKPGFVTGLLLFFLTIEISTAAPEVVAAGGVEKSEITVNFKGRLFQTLVYAPETSNQINTYPLLIVAPGVGNRLLRFVRATNLYKLAEKYQFVIAFPEIDQYYDWFGWLSPAVSENSRNDVAGFFRLVIENVSDQVSIDKKQVYLAGFSTGGVLVLTALCEMADEIAAFAVVSATVPNVWQSRCKPQRSVPALFIASKDDPVLPWVGGQFATPDQGESGLNVISVLDTVDIWRANNKCGVRPLLQSLENIDPADRTTVTRLSYDHRCHNSAVVLLYAIKGGGHSWPGSRVHLNSLQGSISQDLNASDVIWNFVRKYRLKH